MTAKSGAIGHKLCDSLWAALAISTPQAVDEYQETSNDFHKIAYAHVRHLAWWNHELRALGDQKNV